MYRWLGLLLAAFGVACVHPQTTGTARNDWRTPVGYASATQPARVDSTTGVVVNSTTNHGGTYDSRYNNAENAPSSFGSAPPSALQSQAAPLP